MKGVVGAWEGLEKRKGGYIAYFTRLMRSLAWLREEEREREGESVGVGERECVCLCVCDVLYLPQENGDSIK